MSNSRQKPRSNAVLAAGRPALLAAGALLLGGQSHAASAPACANPETVIEAKSSEVETRTNNAVLRDVVITQCDLRVQASEARVKGALDAENNQWTISGDVRITTHVHEDDLLGGLGSTIHETVHALYEHGLPHEHAVTTVLEAESYGLHE